MLDQGSNRTIDEVKGWPNFVSPAQPIQSGLEKDWVHTLCSTVYVLGLYKKNYLNLGSASFETKHQNSIDFEVY